jgi:hypothetical protein
MPKRIWHTGKFKQEFAADRSGKAGTSVGRNDGTTWTAKKKPSNLVIGGH